MELFFEDYPSTSTYNFMPKSPPQYVKRYSKQLNRTLKCASKNLINFNEPLSQQAKSLKQQQQQQQIVSSSTAATTITTTTTTTDEYSTKITTCNYNNDKIEDGDRNCLKSSALAKLASEMSTPVSCKGAKNAHGHAARDRDYNYNHYTISSSKIKMQKSGGRVSNIVKVYNHYHKNQRRNAGNGSISGNKNYARLQIENHRTNQSKLNVFKLNSSNRIENSVEKS